METQRPEALLYKALGLLKEIPAETLKRFAWSLVGIWDRRSTEDAIEDLFLPENLRLACERQQRVAFAECERVGHSIVPIDRLQETVWCVYCWDPSTKQTLVAAPGPLPPGAVRG